eukprot:TRINITY_DN396_c0_g1_i6.p1 TRINITY_DN396_c0_g1~~TRINITY_DN396_c0_g1_i6.p1  ORF type:complete len:316 (+),score=106.73 TRINITY_DN396_c0_g1_i6:114-1061(+)
MSKQPSKKPEPPKKETTAPAPKKDAAPAKAAASTAPPKKDAAPAKAAASTAPPKKDAAPAKAAASTAPPKKDAAPAKKDAAPAKKDAAPAKKDAAPAKKDAAPAKKDAAPAKKDAAPAKKDTAPAKPKAGEKKTEQKKPEPKAQPATATKETAKKSEGKKKKVTKVKAQPQGKAAIKAKALGVKRTIEKGSYQFKSKKVHYTVKFKRPNSKILARDPLYPRRSVPRKNPLTKFSILRHPLATESAMQQIENNSTLVFIVDQRANKKQIKDAVFKMYNIQAAKVNTLIRPDGQKKAYVRLTADADALEVANKIGII